MRKALSLLGALVVTLTLCFISNGNASALGGEQLECRVVTGADVPAFSTDCLPEQPASVYGVAFEVFGGTGTSTYTWTVPAGFQNYGGCGSTDVGCAFSVTAPRSDKDINVSVQVHQGGATETLSAVAEIPATCFVGSTPVDC